MDVLGNSVFASPSQGTRHRPHELPARVQAECRHRGTIRPRPVHAPTATICVRRRFDIQAQLQPPPRILERIHHGRNMDHPRPERQIEASLHDLLEPIRLRQGKIGASTFPSPHVFSLFFF